MPDPMSDALVLVTQEGAVRTLALNRPAALNSFTGAMHLELRAALEAAAADASVRCVVLTGTGRGFCAGQDLSDPMMNSAPDEPPKDVRLVLDAYYQPLLMQLRAMPVPVLAAVNGVAAGAGANIALACDVVVAKASASFIQAFSKIGLIPDAGGTWSVPRLVGRAKAMGLAMLGDKLGVNALATRLAGMPTRALVATRALIDGAQTQTLAQALEAEAAMQSALGKAFDYQEGVAAFQAKRAPVYKDR
jgi:2-(1,2-epoxy-1,2-dihydrophenyl)acetyl-CoA isomerase